MPPAGSSSSDRLRLWLERSGGGFFLRDAASGEPVGWSDPRVRVVKVAGASFRLDAVLTIDPGDRIVLSTLESAWHLEPGRYFEPRDPALDWGHALCGPIEVRGARAGGTLEVRIEALEVGPWGATVVFGNPDLGVDWREEPH